MIYLMRHGVDDESKIGGWSDVSLTNEGIEEVKKAALFIKNNLKIDRIICSDIKRCKETAIIVNEILNKEIVCSSLLRELNKGKLNGMEKEKAYIFYNEFKKINDIYKFYPEGESLFSFYNRIKNDLEEILKSDNTLLITHRGVINMIYFIYNNISLNYDKEQFNVTTGSIHEIDKNLKLIKRIY